ncbi:hypothetical protein AUO94_13670 [Planococcus kocurii]|uniref:RNA-directed DNA polymerase n=1 Tax=Planococcus kocurii TaxID=1374 RepID=A0ABM5WZ38_9BACL|nr:reverse transcriptase domain-containing protein [Planococcus kocurii]ALS79609.1 hypothetical protein AUO94_13670 [Planococcus kocurii]
MHVDLKSEDTAILNKFNSLQTFDDIADLLEIPPKKLWEAVIQNKTYSEFTIPKKNSSNFRVINKPSKNLDIIQKKMNYVLSLAYKSTSNVSHGFEKNKSIRTNAQVHLRKKLILNIDLANYFSSITFPRIRAMFLSYFRFNEVVATTLANICCDNNNELPQGAATSPIISNIITYKLDKDLVRLARKHRSNYTRYADDITFSTNRKEFQSDIFNMDEDFYDVGDKVIELISKNGFSINTSKTRIHDSSQPKYVTGVKVNTKLNLNKRYIRRIRSILHCIEKNINSLDEAITIFEAKYPFRKTKFKNRDMFNIVRGMISHLGHIKGKQDHVYQKLAIRYNLIISAVNGSSNENYPYIHRPLTHSEFREQNVYVIESDFVNYKFFESKKNIVTYQGSGFLLKEVGLVTNYHVVKEYIEILEEENTSFEEEYYIPLSKSRYSQDIWFAKIIMYDKARDLAVLHINIVDHFEHGFNYNQSITEGMDSVIIGYPEYKESSSLHIDQGKILGERIHYYNDKRFTRYSTRMPIHGGNSGGPIVNMKNEVIAVAVKGKDNSVTEVIPVSDLLKSIEAKEMCLV